MVFLQSVQISLRLKFETFLVLVHLIVLDLLANT